MTHRKGGKDGDKTSNLLSTEPWSFGFFGIRGSTGRSPSSRFEVTEKFGKAKIRMVAEVFEDGTGRTFVEIHEDGTKTTLSEEGGRYETEWLEIEGPERRERLRKLMAETKEKDEERGRQNKERIRRFHEGIRRDQERIRRIHEGIRQSEDTAGRMRETRGRATGSGIACEVQRDERGEIDELGLLDSEDEGTLECLS